LFARPQTSWRSKHLNDNAGVILPWGPGPVHRHNAEAPLPAWPLGRPEA